MPGRGNIGFSPTRRGRGREQAPLNAICCPFLCFATSTTHALNYSYSSSMIQGVLSGDGQRAHQPRRREVGRSQEDQQQQQHRHPPSLTADGENESGFTHSGGEMWSVLQGLRRRQRHQQRQTGAYAVSAAASTSASTSTTRSASSSASRSVRSGSKPRHLSLVSTGLVSFLAMTGCLFAPLAEATVVPNGAMVWDGNGWMALVDDPSAPLPPPPKTESWKRKDTQLFVGVSSFRDKRCPQTLVNYFTKAKYPARVTVGVVQQNDHADIDCVTEYCNMMGGFEEGSRCPHFNNIKTLRVDAKHAAGPCYGRHLQVSAGWVGFGWVGLFSVLIWLGLVWSRLVWCWFRFGSFINR